MALINLGQRLFMNFRRADVTFVVDREEIPGHRLILAETSPYFDAFLCGNFEESRSKRVKITVTSAKVFKEVMRFIYLGRLEIFNWEIVDILALLSSAHEYQLQQLIDEVTKALEKKHLDFDSWELVKSAASLYDSDALKAKCLSFAETKIDDFLSCRDLEMFTAEFILSMLDSPKIVSCNQDHLVFAICEWKNRHNVPGVSSMLTKINWTKVSPAITNLVLKDMFSNAKNEEDFGFWTKVAEMKKKPETVARVESVYLVKYSNVAFALEKYQCSIVFHFGYYLTQHGISIDFTKGNNGSVVIAVQRIEFESSTKFDVASIYGCKLKLQFSDMVTTEYTLPNGWFKYTAVFPGATSVFSIKIVMLNVKLFDIRLRNIVIS